MSIFIENVQIHLFEKTSVTVVQQHQQQPW